MRHVTGAQGGEGKGKWLEYTSVGLMFPASILVGFFIGQLLDKWLRTAPWLTLLFILYGIAAAFRNLLALARRRDAKK